MHVLVWPADEAGCGMNRLEWPARALAAQGADVEVSRVGPTVLWAQPWKGDVPPGDAQVCGVHKPDADVVVIQRPGSRHWVEVIPLLQAHGVRVVVDVDDDFTRIPRENKAHAAYDPQVNPWHNYELVLEACRRADAVTCTTPALADRFGFGKATVIPNMVPGSYLSVEAARDGLTVGWTGSVDTHPHDLEVTAGGVHRALMCVPGGRLKVIGTGAGVERRLGHLVDESTGWTPIEEYPRHVATLDVGVVPLCDSAFNRAKSSLKMGEMAALGVVPVVSPTPDNLRLHGLGVGVVAVSPAQWKKQVARLLAQPGWRAEVAVRSREAMAGQTYEGQCGRWADVWIDHAKAVAA